MKDEKEIHPSSLILHPFRRIPPNVFWLGVVSLLNDFSSEMIFPLLPGFFLTVLGASPAALGAMEGVVDSIASLLRLWSGRLADRLPRRKPLVILGYSLTSFVRPLFLAVTAPWQVVAIRIVDRTGKGIRGSPRDALIADSADPGARGRAFGFHRSMDHLGAIAGPLTALILIPLLFGARELRPGDYRLLFGIAAIPAILSVGVLVLKVREQDREARRSNALEPVAGVGTLGRGEDGDTQRRGGAARGRRGDTGQGAGAPAYAATPEGEAALGRGFWYLLGVITLFTLGNSSDVFLVQRARDAGMGIRDVYLIWALLHVVRSALSTPAGALSDRVPRRALIVAGWLVYAVVYLGFGWASTAWHLWVLFGVYGLYNGLAEGSEKALVTDLVPVRARGTAFGWYNGAVGIAALPASLIFGLLWQWRGAHAAFGFGAALALLASALLLLGPKGRMPAPDSEP